MSNEKTLPTEKKPLRVDIYDDQIVITCDDEERKVAVLKTLRFYFITEERPGGCSHRLTAERRKT